MMYEIIKYLHSYVTGNESQLKDQLDKCYLKLGHKEFKQAMYLRKLLELDVRSREELEKLLEALSISKDDYDRYINSDLTVYKLLQALRKNGHRRIQLDGIMQLLDDRMATPTWIKALLGVSVVVTLMSVMSQIGLFTVTNYIQLAIAGVGGLPVIGLVGTGALALYTLFTNHTDKTRSFFERFIDNLFTTIQTALNVASYAFWITAATVAMTPLVASLSVAAAAIDFAKEIFLFIDSTRKFFNTSAEKNRHLLFGIGSLEQAFLEEKNFLESKSAFKQHRNAAAINLSTVALIVGITSVWNFFPPALVVTASCVIAMVAVYAIKTLLIKRNEANIKRGLQKELMEHDNTFRNCPANNAVQNEVSLTVNSNIENKAKVEADSCPNWHHSSPPQTIKHASNFFGHHRTSVANSGKQLPDSPSIIPTKTSSI